MYRVNMVVGHLRVGRAQRVAQRVGEHPHPAGAQFSVKAPLIERTHLGIFMIIPVTDIVTESRPYPRRRPCGGRCCRRSLERRGRRPSRCRRCRWTRWSSRRPRPGGTRRGRPGPRNLSSWRVLMSPGRLFSGTIIGRVTLKVMTP